MRASVSNELKSDVMVEVRNADNAGSVERGRLDGERRQTWARMDLRYVEREG